MAHCISYRSVQWDRQRPVQTRQKMIQQLETLLDMATGSLEAFFCVFDQVAQLTNDSQLAPASALDQIRALRAPWESMGAQRQELLASVWALHVFLTRYFEQFQEDLRRGASSLVKQPEAIRKSQQARANNCERKYAAWFLRYLEMGKAHPDWTPKCISNKIFIELVGSKEQEANSFFYEESLKGSCFNVEGNALAALYKRMPSH